MIKRISQLSTKFYFLGLAFSLALSAYSYYYFKSSFSQFNQIQEIEKEIQYLTVQHQRTSTLSSLLGLAIAANDLESIIKISEKLAQDKTLSAHWQFALDALSSKAKAKQKPNLEIKKIAELVQHEAQENQSRL